MGSLASGAIVLRTQNLKFGYKEYQEHARASPVDIAAVFSVQLGGACGSPFKADKEKAQLNGISIERVLEKITANLKTIHQGWSMLHEKLQAIAKPRPTTTGSPPRSFAYQVCLLYSEPRRNREDIQGKRRVQMATKRAQVKTDRRRWDRPRGAPLLSFKLHAIRTPSVRTASDDESNFEFHFTDPEPDDELVFQDPRARSFHAGVERNPRTIHATVGGRGGVGHSSLFEFPRTLSYLYMARLAFIATRAPERLLFTGSSPSVPDFTLVPNTKQPSSRTPSPTPSNPPHQLTTSQSALDNENTTTTSQWPPSIDQLLALANQLSFESRSEALQMPQLQRDIDIATSRANPELLPPRASATGGVVFTRVQAAQLYCLGVNAGVLSVPSVEETHRWRAFFAFLAPECLIVKESFFSLARPLTAGFATHPPNRLRNASSPNPLMPTPEDPMSDLTDEEDLTRESHGSTAAPPRRAAKAQPRSKPPAKPKPPPTEAQLKRALLGAQRKLELAEKTLERHNGTVAQAGSLRLTRQKDIDPEAARNRVQQSQAAVNLAREVYDKACAAFDACQPPPAQPAAALTWPTPTEPSATQAVVPQPPATQAAAAEDADADDAAPSQPPPPATQAAAAEDADADDAAPSQPPPPATQAAAAEDADADDAAPSQPPPPPQPPATQALGGFEGFEGGPSYKPASAWNPFTVSNGSVPLGTTAATDLRSLRLVPGQRPLFTQNPPRNPFEPPPPFAPLASASSLMPKIDFSGERNAPPVIKRTLQQPHLSQLLSRNPFTLGPSTSRIGAPQQGPEKDARMVDLDEEEEEEEPPATSTDAPGTDARGEKDARMVDLAEEEEEEEPPATSTDAPGTDARGEKDARMVDLDEEEEEEEPPATSTDAPGTDARSEKDARTDARGEKDAHTDARGEKDARMVDPRDETLKSLLSPLQTTSHDDEQYQNAVTKAAMKLENHLLSFDNADTDDADWTDPATQRKRSKSQESGKEDGREQKKRKKKKNKEGGEEEPKEDAGEKKKRKKKKKEGGEEGAVEKKARTKPAKGKAKAKAKGDPKSGDESSDESGDGRKSKNGNLHKNWAALTEAEQHAKSLKCSAWLKKALERELKSGQGGWLGPSRKHLGVYARTIQECCPEAGSLSYAISQELHRSVQDDNLVCGYHKENKGIKARVPDGEGGPGAKFQIFGQPLPTVVEKKQDEDTDGEEEDDFVLVLMFDCGCIAAEVILEYWWWKQTPAITREIGGSPSAGPGGTLIRATKGKKVTECKFAATSGPSHRSRIYRHGTAPSGPSTPS
ncbi:hypothetical protein C8R43DRAFT_965734, partial [Mycena crocata]